MISSWWWKHKKTQEKTCSSNNIWQFRLMSQPRLFFLQRIELGATPLTQLGKPSRTSTLQWRSPTFHFQQRLCFVDGTLCTGTHGARCHWSDFDFPTLKYLCFSGSVGFIEISNTEHTVSTPPPQSILMNVRYKGAKKNPTKLRITKTHRISTTLHTSGSTGKSKASRHKVSAEKTKVVKIDASINTSYSLVNQRLLMVI